MRKSAVFGLSGDSRQFQRGQASRPKTRQCYLTTKSEPALIKKQWPFSQVVYGDRLELTNQRSSILILRRRFESCSGRSIFFCHRGARWWDVGAPAEWRPRCCMRRAATPHPIKPPISFGQYIPSSVLEHVFADYCAGESAARLRGGAVGRARGRFGPWPLRRPLLASWPLVLARIGPLLTRACSRTARVATTSCLPSRKSQREVQAKLHRRSASAGSSGRCTGGLERIGEREEPPTMFGPPGSAGRGRSISEVLPAGSVIFWPSPTTARPEPPHSADQSFPASGFS